MENTWEYEAEVEVDQDWEKKGLRGQKGQLEQLKKNTAGKGHILYVDVRAVHTMLY